jgi:hypothetical protein
MKVLPVVQARQISDLLQDLQAKGELRDAQDYKKALAKLIGLVNAKDPKPMYKQLRAIIWGLVRSDVHNTMMQAAKNDLEAVFLQVDEIGRRLDDHHFYIMKGLISDLEKALQDQEDRIRELKMIATKNNEFSDVVYNSFARTSLKKLDRSDPSANLLFFDARTDLPVTEDDVPSAYVSEHGKKIVIASKNEPKILPIHAKLLFDEESYGTSLVSEVNNSISNILDGTPNTFWSRTVYADEPVEKMSTIIQFDLGTGRDINYCIIEGATTEPFFITEMSGVGLDGHEVDLLLKRSVTSSTMIDNDYLPEETNEVAVDGWARIDFQQTFVKAVRIKFSYGTFKEADYYTTTASDATAVYEADYPVDMTAADIAAIASEVVVSDEMAELCSIPPTETTHINSNVYMFALDNVWFGNSLYNDASLFVSQAVHLDAPGVLSIKAEEKNVGVYSEGTDSFVTETIEITDVEDLADDSPKNAGSVEYEAVRDSVDEDGYTKRDHFPVPLLDQSMVIRERLILTKRATDPIQNDAGCLRFCPRTAARVSWVYVFRNGTLLSPGEDMWEWAVSTDIAGNLEWHSSSSIYDGVYTEPTRQWWNFRRWTLSPQKLWLKVFPIDPGDVYTVSYMIRTSTLNESDIQDPYDDEAVDPIDYPLTPIEGRVYMNKEKTIYMGDGGRLCFLPDPETGLTKAADIYTQITLRRNSSYYALSPEVIEYAFLSAPYNPGIE